MMQENGLFLSQQSFQHLLEGTFSEEHEAYSTLKTMGVLREDLDTEELATKIRRKKLPWSRSPLTYCDYDASL